LLTPFWRCLAFFSTISAFTFSQHEKFADSTPIKWLIFSAIIIGGIFSVFLLFNYSSKIKKERKILKKIYKYEAVLAN